MDSKRAILWITSIFVAAHGVAVAGPDLSLAWVSKLELAERAEKSEQVGYEISNLGDEDAFAILLELPASGGHGRRTVRISPGPRAGSGFTRYISRPLLEASDNPCLSINLQTLNVGDARDADDSNNRICAEQRR